MGSKGLGSGLGASGWDAGFSGAESRQEGIKEGPRPAGTTARSSALSLNSRLGGFCRERHGGGMPGADREPTAESGCTWVNREAHLRFKIAEE